MNWKEVIVGDAFRLPSRELNFDRDVLLFWPILLFSVGTLTSLFGKSHDFRLAIKLAVASALSILLSRERLLLIGAAIGFCSVQSAVSFFLKHDPAALAVAIVTGAVLILSIPWLRDYNPVIAGQAILALQSSYLACPPSGSASFFSGGF